MKLEQKQVNPYAPPEVSPDPHLEVDMELLEGLGAPSLGRRFLAVVIDNILITLLAAALGVGLITLEVDPDLIGPLNLLLTFSIRVPYYALMESSSMQATFGKRALGLVVVDQQGARLSVGRSFGRAISRSLLLMISLPAIWVAIDKRGRGIWDHIAGTRVLERYQLYLLAE